MVYYLEIKIMSRLLSFDRLSNLNNVRLDIVKEMTKTNNSFY